MQSCKELWVPRARDGGGPGCPRPPNPPQEGVNSSGEPTQLEGSPGCGRGIRSTSQPLLCRGLGSQSSPRGSALASEGNPQGQGVKSCCHLCLRLWGWGLSPPTLPGEGKTKSPGPSPGRAHPPPWNSTSLWGDDERGELLGLIEGCQDRPDHLGAPGFGSFHLRVHIQQVLGPVHGHVVLVVGQAGEDVLQNI